MHRPTAVPRIPSSARGVSTQRSAPKRSCSPAVARKTPPSLPTSWPMTRTEGSRSISTWSASLTASTRNRSAMPEDPPELREIVGLRGRRVGVRMLEHEPHVGGTLGFGFRDPGTHHGEGLLLRFLRLGIRQDSEAHEIPLVSTHALVLALL